MTPVEFFKREAKYLHKDYQTKTPDETYGYLYSPKYFDMNDVIFDFDVDEEKFTLMKAQHTIALMIGFKKWTDFLNASEEEMELAKLLFENRILLEDWKMWLGIVERESQIDFDDSESQLNLLKEYLENDGFEPSLEHYRFKQSQLE